MKRPSFQFYPADWRNNSKLRRCSEAARGAWIDILCILHDSDEYGLLRWPLYDISRAAGISESSAEELVSKGVLKGNDGRVENFTFTPRHAGKDGETSILIHANAGPCWFCSRMVTDEWIRNRRGAETRFETTPKATPKATPKSCFGYGSTSPTPTPKEKKVASLPKPSLEEVKLVVAKSGLPESDAVWFWNKCEGNGWTNGGKPIKSWPNVIASWKAAGYLPSQKAAASQPKFGSTICPPPYQSHKGGPL